MGKLLNWALCGFVLLLLADCSSTPKRPHTQEAPWRPATAMLLVYAAPDGSLTRAQLDTGLRRDFAKADVNHNGCLSPDEVRAINQQRLKDDESTASPLIDFKNTGCLDFEEYAAAPRSLFDQLDVHGTGKLTAQQLKPGSKPATPPGQSPDSTDAHHHHGGGGNTGSGGQ
jgi:hypothetical protein